ncbi:hypothetical protein G9A89_018616 [Geosiphon pyriformis]|nr:hypothetical protein G9A89_018616 [Geosiphon pyriformis]
MCGHFKPSYIPVPLINLEEEKPKPTWEAYQVSWADVDHNKLLPILTWDDNDQEKGKKRKNLPGTLTKPEKSTMIKKTHQPGSGREAIKKKKKKIKKTDLKPIKPPKPAPVAGEDSTQPTPDQSHHMKTTEYALITIVNHVTVNVMDIQSAKASRTTNHVLLMANSYSMKRYGITFLVEEECVTLYVSTQSLLATG